MYMRAAHICIALAFSSIIICASGTNVIQLNELEFIPDNLETENNEQTNFTENVSEIYAEIPAWNVGDKWTYSTILDASTALPDNPDWDDADLNQPLTGNTIIEISQYSTYEYNGDIIPVYLRTYSGIYQGPAVFPTPDGVDFLLETISGTLDVEYQRTEYIRASDLAVFEIQAHIKIEFQYSLGTETLIDTSSNVKYFPAYEYHDFPVFLNESWSSVHRVDESWDGNNGYFEAPAPSSDVEYVFEVIENGTPPHIYEGCEEAVNISNINTNGEQIEWMWFCESIRAPTLWWVKDIAVNVNAELRLIDYIPAANTPANYAEIHLDPKFERLNATLSELIDLTISITDSEGSPVSGMNGKISYCSQTINWTTGLNGTVTISLDVGLLKDDTVTLYDWGSHGIVFVSDSNITYVVKTIVLNSSAVAEAIALRNEGAELIQKSSFPALELVRSFDKSIRW